jgi:hypothetical protein
MLVLCVVKKQFYITTYNTKLFNIKYKVRNKTKNPLSYLSSYVYKHPPIQ